MLTLSKKWRRELLRKLNKDHSYELSRTFIRYELLKQLFKDEPKVRALTPQEMSAMDDELEEILDELARC